MEVGFRGSNVASVGAAAARSVGAAGVGVDTESSTGGVNTVVVEFRGIDVVSVGVAADWSAGAADPHPAMTAITLDTRAALTRQTTSFLILTYGHNRYQTAVIQDLMKSDTPTLQETRTTCRPT